MNQYWKDADSVWPELCRATDLYVKNPENEVIRKWHENLQQYYDRCVQMAKKKDADDALKLLESDGIGVGNPEDMIKAIILQNLE